MALIGKDTITVSISVLALCVSITGLYRTGFRETHQLSAVLLDAFQNDEGALEIKLVFINSGNRDAAVTRFEPLIWSGPGPDSQKRWEWVRPAPIVLPADPTVVLKPGDVQIVTLLRDASNLRTFYATTPMIAGLMM